MLCRAFRRANVVPRLAPAKRQIQREPTKADKALQRVGRLLYRTSTRDDTRHHRTLGIPMCPACTAASVMASTRADVLMFGHADQPNCVRPAMTPPILRCHLPVCISGVRPRLPRLPHVILPYPASHVALVPCTPCVPVASLATSRCIASSLPRGSQLATPDVSARRSSLPVHLPEPGPP